MVRLFLLSLLTRELDMQLICLNARHPFAVRIGSGVGSEHYLALQQGEGESFRRLVMVKKLSSLLRDSARTEMMREVKAAASLSHPNVVRVFGAERSGGHLLISMEYIRGYGLAELLEGLKEAGAQMPVGIFMRLLLQACEALDYAQRAVDIAGEPLRLVHRNISPESIKVDEEGYLRVIDFGLSKFAQAEDATLPGQIKGTWEYMPLEQMRGHPLDVRSDIFSLGMTFYEAYTLQRPRQARNMKAAFDEASEMPSVGRLSDHRPCPDELETVLAKATARDPNERYDSGREMADALEAAAREGVEIASFNEVRDWLSEQFTNLHGKRRSFEKDFIAAIEHNEMNEQSASEPVDDWPELDSGSARDGSEVEQTASRWVLYSALAFLLGMATSAVFVASTYSTSGQVTEGFYVGESEDVASVFVLSRPAQAAVSLDGKFIGHTTQLGMTIRLEPGEKHRISLTRVGYEPFDETIVASAGATQRLIAKLDPVVPKVKSHELRPLPRLPAAVLPEPEEIEPAPVEAANLEDLEAESLELVEPTPSGLVGGEPVERQDVAPEPVAQPAEGLRVVRWGMDAADVRALEVGKQPVKVSDRMMSYSGTIYDEGAWLNYIFVDGGLKGVIYLFTRSDSTHETYDKLLQELKANLGSPSNSVGSLDLGKVVTWQRDEGEVKLVLSRKRKSGQSIKIMDLSMSWESFNVELGTGSR